MFINITEPKIFNVFDLLINSKTWFVCIPDIGPVPVSIRFTKKR